MVLGVFIAVGIVGIAANVAVDVARRVDKKRAVGVVRDRRLYTPVGKVDTVVVAVVNNTGMDNSPRDGEVVHVRRLNYKKDSPR